MEHFRIASGLSPWVGSSVTARLQLLPRLEPELFAAPAAAASARSCSMLRHLTAPNRCVEGGGSQGPESTNDVALRIRARSLDHIVFEHDAFCGVLF